MKEHQILFNPLMVQAIIESRKLMTRRIIDPQPEAGKYPQSELDGFYWKNKFYLAVHDRKTTSLVDNSRYGQPGDLLWVKETFFAYGHWTCIIDTDGKMSWSFQDLTISEGFQYKYVDCPPETVNEKRGSLGWYKRPSMFMPKTAARIWLQVEEIRVERLRGISEADARYEGVKFGKSTMGNCYFDYISGGYNIMTTAYKSFRTLWLKINGEESWKANPWVWVVKFKILSTTGKPQMCYKTNDICKYNCNGLCRESC